MGVSNYLPNNALTRPGICTSTTRPASPYEGQAIYETDTDVFRFWNGSAWQAIQLPPDIVANTVTGTTSVRANSGGVDGGIVMRPWTGTPSWPSVATNGMVGNEYILRSDGIDTWISGGVAGVTSIRAGNDDTSGQVVVGANSVQMNGNVSMNGRLTTSNQPYVRVAGAGANWFQPGATRLANGTPSGFSWAVAQNVGGHFNAATGLFVAPVTGVYLCTFQSYQQTYGGVSWIHWMWEIGGSIAWNNGDGAYNIFGYFSGNYADGVGTTVMVEVGAGNGIGIRGIMGGDERFYSNYTYMAIRLLG